MTRQQPHLARGPKVKAACGGRCSAAVLRHKPRHLIYDASCQRRLGSAWSYQHHQHLTSPLLIQTKNQPTSTFPWMTLRNLQRPSLNLWIPISSNLPRSDHHLDHQDHIWHLWQTLTSHSYVLYVTPPGPPVLLGILPSAPRSQTSSYLVTCDKLQWSFSTEPCLLDSLKWRTLQNAQVVGAGHQ